MNTRSLFLIFLVIVLMCGSASAAIPQDFRFAFNYTEGSGSTAYNQNTSNSDMTVYGTDVWSVANATYYNGSSGSYGIIPDGTDTDILDTITVSVTGNAANNNNAIFLSKFYGYQLRLVNSKPRFVIWNSSVTQFTCESPDTITLTGDHTLQGVANGTHMSIIVDGVVKNTILYTENDIRNSPNPVTTGAQVGDSGNQKALLYDTYIYARALNTTELESLEGAGGGTPPVETGFTVASELQNDRIKITAGSGNLTELSNTEYASNYFWKDGTIMYCNKSIWVYGGSKLWINDTDITEFRVASPNVLYAIHFDSGQANEIIIDGVAVTEWDFNTSMVKNTNNRKLIVSNINNTTINGFSEVSCNEMDNKSIISNVDIIGGNTTDGFIAFYGDSDSRTYDINIDTINIVNGSRKGLYFKNLYNATIQDIFLDNLTIDTVSNTEMQYISYSLFKNFTMTNCYSESGEQRAFFVMSGTDANQSIGNIYDNFILRANEKPPSDNGANGIQVEGQYNAIYRNLIIENSAHDLIDMHFSKNTLIDGFNINQTFSNGIIITGDYYKSKNLDNVTIKNGVIGMTPTGNGIHGHSLISNVTIENVTFNYRGIDLSCDNLKIINVSILNYIDSLSGITLTDYDHSAYGEPLAENNVIIDSDVYRLDVLTVNNANVINTHYNITGGTNFTEYFYINVRCLNTTECPVSGAVMTFDTTALDGWGHNLTSVTSDEKGYFHITGNRSTFAALQKDIPTLVTVTKSGETDTATVTPDTEWYSTNTSTGGLSGTLYTFTLDVPGEVVNDTYTIETQAEKFPVSTFIISSFVAVVAGFFGLRFGNQRRKR